MHACICSGTRLFPSPLQTACAESGFAPLVQANLERDRAEKRSAREAGTLEASSLRVRPKLKRLELNRLSPRGHLAGLRSNGLKREKEKSYATSQWSEAFSKEGIENPNSSSRNKGEEHRGHGVELWDKKKRRNKKTTPARQSCMYWEGLAVKAFSHRLPGNATQSLGR
eukprot:1139958-Pelagomonas_calceolata.AAC.1